MVTILAASCVFPLSLYSQDRGENGNAALERLLDQCQAEMIQAVHEAGIRMDDSRSATTDAYFRVGTVDEINQLLVQGSGELRDQLHTILSVLDGIHARCDRELLSFGFAEEDFQPELNRIRLGASGDARFNASGYLHWLNIASEMARNVVQDKKPHIALLIVLQYGDKDPVPNAD